MMDVDGFKLFNDTYGHQEGDRLLKQVADVLRSQFDEKVIVGTLRRRRVHGRFFPGSTARRRRSTARVCWTRWRRSACRPHRGGDLPVRAQHRTCRLPRRQHPQGRADRLRRRLAVRSEAAFGAASLVVAHDEPGDVLSRQRTPFGVLDALVRAVDRKDRYTRRHSQQNAEFAVDLGKGSGSPRVRSTRSASADSSTTSARSASRTISSRSPAL